MFVTKDIKLSCMIELFCPKYRVCFFIPFLLFHKVGITRGLHGLILSHANQLVWPIVKVKLFGYRRCMMRMAYEEQLISQHVLQIQKIVHFVSRVWAELSKSWRKQKNKWLGNYQLFWIVKKCLRLWWKNKLGLILATVNSSPTRRKSGFTEFIDSLKFKPVLFSLWHGLWDMVAKWKESEIAQRRARSWLNL